MLDKKKILTAMVITAVLGTANIVHAANPDDTLNIHELTLEDKVFENKGINSTDGITVTVDESVWQWNSETNMLTKTDGTESFYLPNLIQNNTDGVIKNPTTGEIIGKVSVANGGAIIAIDYEQVTVVGSKFSNNQINLSGKGLNSEQMATYSGFGGAISANGKLNVANSEFTGNKVSVKYTENSNYTNENGSQEKWVTNGEVGTGGAINNTGELTVTDSKFTGNSAAYGGAVNNNGAALIKNSEFTNNTANSLISGKTTFTYNDKEYTKDYSSYTGHGGAINSMGDITIEGSKFNTNIAAESGGAVISFGNVVIKNSEFKNNTAKSKSDEGYYSVNEQGEVVYNDMSDSEGHGGAVAAAGRDEHKLTVENSYFEGNVSGSEGGGAIATFITTEINNSIFKNNQSEGSGGAIAVLYENPSLSILNSTFIGNTSADFGGAVNSYDNLVVDNSIFTDNKAVYGGGAIEAYGDENTLISIKNSTFENNKAMGEDGTGAGGALSLGINAYDPYGEAKLTNNVIIDNTIFKNNSSGDGGDGGGGAVWIYNENDSQKQNITNSKFISNSTAGDGGGIIYMSGNGGSTLNIENTDFENNSAKSGGGIYVDSGKLHIKDSSFTGNTAKENGGAIYIGANSEEQTFQQNPATITALNKDVLFRGNTAAKGGDIYISDGILNLNANMGRQIKFDGGIVGKDSIININDSSVNSLYENLSSVGKIVIDNFVSPDETSSLSVNLKAGTLALTKDNYLNGTDLTLEEGSLLDLANNNVGEMNLNSLTSNNANLKIDMNLASSNQIFDTIKANTATGILNLQNVNIMSDFADTTKNEYTASITPDGMELKTPENGINVLTNDYVYTITAKDNNLTVNRLADENGEALKTDGFTVAVNQTNKVGGVDVTLSDDRIYSANSDIKITATNSETGWTGNLGGKSLTVNGNGYTLDGEDNIGFAINNGQTLTFNDTNIKGFAPTPERKAALTINDGGTVNINASNSDVSIGSNSSKDVIYLDGTSSKAFLTTENNKSITLNYKISSANSSNELNLNGNGKITFAGIAQKLTLNNNNSNTVHNAHVDGVNYNLNSGMVTFAKDEYLNGQGNKNTLSFNGGTLNLANNSVGTIDLAAININSNSNIMLDADLAQETMDKITADSATTNKDAILNVSEINLLSDSTKDKVEINAVDPTITLNENDTLANHIAISVTEVAYSPIYKYGVGYDPTTGNFSFTRGSSQNYNNVNPSVMVGPVAAQLGGYMGMLDTYNNAFNNMDMRMLNPSSVRMAQKQANRYAITEEADGVTYKVNETNSGGTWIRPFAAYDSVGLSNGPKVSNMSYGTFIGGDSAIHQFKNGGEGVLSAHVSYLGSHQSFNGNSIYQNGGNLGLTGTYYKGNFFSGLTVNAGASVADASTRYGNEDFPMLTAGVANKTGYNFEFKDGKFIIQPSLLLSYTFVNTFDYTNAAGVSINGDPLHAFQISPNVRFALNTKNNWQPYFTVGMNWNIMNDSEFTANMATLPDLSIKPYVQYGLGIQKTINDNFTAYGQVLLRHGGRNGIAANAGLRYIFGHESKPNENI